MSVSSNTANVPSHTYQPITPSSSIPPARDPTVLLSDKVEQLATALHQSQEKISSTASSLKNSSEDITQALGEEVSYIKHLLLDDQSQVSEDDLSIAEQKAPQEIKFLKECDAKIAQLKSRNQELSTSKYDKKRKMMFVAAIACFVAAGVMLVAGAAMMVTGILLPLGASMVGLAALALIGGGILLYKKDDYVIEINKNAEEIRRLERLKDPKFQEFVKSLVVDGQELTISEIEKYSLHPMMERLYAKHENIEAREYWVQMNFAENKLRFYNEQIYKLQNIIITKESEIENDALNFPKTSRLQEEIQIIKDKIEQYKNKKLEIKQILPPLDNLPAQNRDQLLRIINECENTHIYSPYTDFEKY